LTPDAYLEWVAARTVAVRQHIPAAFREATLDPQSEAAAWCAGVLAGQPDNLLLQGPKGVGKTHTGWACWPHLISLGWTGAFRMLTEQTFLTALLPEGERMVATWAGTADVLLLDDVGASPAGDWSRSRVLGLLDERWSHGLPTVVTTNLPHAALAIHLGDRASSRLRHHLTAVSLKGADRRTA